MRWLRPTALWALAAVLASPAVAGGPAGVRVAPVRFVDAAPRGPGVEERLAEIRRRIQGALEYPPVARWQRLEGEALVRFQVDAAGSARDVRLAHSSGRPSLDRAAERAVLAASPLPWVYGLLEVPVRFELDARR
jgi:TonB family protein